MNKHSQEAYLLIDHRNSPGTTQVPGGQVFESAMVVCHCCGSDIILNPKRTREREWCMEHDAYMCDRCTLTRKLTGSCIPLKKKFSDLFERITRRL
jgi:hypothetical protein